MAVLGGLATLWLAVKSDDGLVASDYYRRGLAINQTLSRRVEAERRRYAARVTFGADGRSVRVEMTGSGTLPPAVQLRLAHPTRAELDQVLVISLRRSASRLPVAAACCCRMPPTLGN
jgi:hypothetical protein